MGKSGTTSCFKFVGCGNPDSVDRDDHPAAEIKDSSDKRKWSFRKKPALHRVLSNTVVSETSLSNKASHDTATVGFQKQPISTETDPKLAGAISPTALEKTTADVLSDESLSVEQNTSDSTPNEFSVVEKNAADITPDELSDVEKTAAKVTSDEFSVVEKNATDATPDEFSAVEKNAVDATPDKFSAVENNAADATRDEFSVMEKREADATPNEISVVENSKEDVTPVLPNVIIIQTAIRGFLAQKDLVMMNKATVMLQAAIRGHIVRKTAMGSLRCLQAIVKMQVLIKKRHANLLLEGGSRFGDENDRILDKQDSKGMEKLGSKPVVSYTLIEELLRNSFARQLLESNLKSKTINIKCEPLKSDSAWKWMERWMSIYSTEINNSMESKSSDEESILPSETDVNAIKYGMHTFESINDMGGSCSVTTSLEERYDHDMFDSFPKQPTESSFDSNKEPDSLTNPSEIEYKEQSSCDSITEPNSLTNQSNSSETTGKKVLFGSRRSSNSAFIAAQSKFEELSLAATNSVKPVGSSKQNASLQLSSDDGIFLVTDVTKRKTVPAEETESVTELSVSSKHDSQHENVIDATYETTVLEDKDEFQKNHRNFIVDNEVDSPVLEGTFVHEGKNENFASDESKEDNSATVIRKTESDKSGGVKVHMKTEISHPPSTLSPQASPRSHVISSDSHDTPSNHVSMKPKKSSRKNVHTEPSYPLNTLSPQASPKSHVTVQDSQETPSSQVSTKTKKINRKSVPTTHSQKSLSSFGNGGYKSDSGARNDLEQLSMDNKTGKRRNSFGSVSTDHGNQEQNETSISSNSIPSYMQATESARAKAIANNSSPKSSPDTLHIKKRHSLPGVNTKHVQQSTSHTIHDTKANGVHSPQERKWRR